MERIIVAFIWLAGDLNFVWSIELLDSPTLGSKNAPRLLSQDSVEFAFDYQENQNHTVLFYKHDSEDMYVGGTDFVLRVDTDNYHILEKYDMQTVGQEQCQEDSCQNIITVIEDFNDSLFVCGTNGHKPLCWTLDPSINKSEESYDGTGISPFIPSQNSLSLTVEGDLYAAAALDSDGSSLQFRRKAGSRANVWMYDNWVSEPTFISASWVKRENDSDNEKIYVFFREKNSDNNPEADPWISRVARVCKVDEGGSKRFFQNIWTSFIKARLVCGFPEESLYFNRLQDIYVLHDNGDWNNTRIYAIFTSSWNSTAVCIYTIGMIEDVFENSTFKGYDHEIPSPRPGTCVENSKNLPLDTVRMVKDYPEMVDWVHSVHYKAPFYVSNYNYTKIAVDRVQAADHNTYNVLLLATDTGKIHKVLEAGSEPFIISETQLLSQAILSMKLDPKKKKLVVGFSKNISTVDLQMCEEYNKSCEDCVLARDPYCAWTEAGLTCTTATVLNGIQNLMTGNPDVCPKSDIKQVIRTKREELTPLLSSLPAVHAVPLAMPFYLSCPIDSYHADYSWKHGDFNSPCQQMKSNCLHLIDAMAQENYGIYQCISKEKHYLKVVKEYHLTVQNITKPDSRVESHNLNNALPIVPQVVWILFGLVIAVLNILH